MARCYDKNASGFKSYGGRGIEVCERWHDFGKFFSDTGVPPFVGASLDRIDNDGNYEPTNCRWADRKTQSENRRILFKQKKYTSLPGAYFDKRYGTWHSRIGKKYLGKFDSADSASEAYLKAKGMEKTKNDPID